MGHDRVELDLGLAPASFTAKTAGILNITSPTPIVGRGGNDGSGWVWVEINMKGNTLGGGHGLFQIRRFVLTLDRPNPLGHNKLGPGCSHVYGVPQFNYPSISAVTS
jgi:hypothetical protein